MTLQAFIKPGGLAFLFRLVHGSRSDGHAYAAVVLEGDVSAC